MSALTGLNAVNICGTALTLHVDLCWLLCLLLCLLLPLLLVP